MVEVAQNFGVRLEDHDGFAAWTDVRHACGGESLDEFRGAFGRELQRGAGEGFRDAFGDEFVAPACTTALGAGFRDVGGNRGEQVARGDATKQGRNGVDLPDVASELLDRKAERGELFLEVSDTCRVGWWQSDGFGNQQRLGRGGVGVDKLFVDDSFSCRTRV